MRAFKAFVSKGNVADVAAGVMIAGTFVAAVSALVKGVLLPAVGLLLGGADPNELFSVLRPGTPAGPYASLAAAQEAGALVIGGAGSSTPPSPSSSSPSRCSWPCARSTG